MLNAIQLLRHHAEAFIKALGRALDDKSTNVTAMYIVAKEAKRLAHVLLDISNRAAHAINALESEQKGVQAAKQRLGDITVECIQYGNKEE